MYAQKVFVLKTSGRMAVLKIETDGRKLNYMLSGREEGELYLFINEKQFFALGKEDRGERPCTTSAKSFIAAAIVKDGKILMKTEVNRFHWASALRYCLPKQEKNPEQAVKNTLQKERIEEKVQEENIREQKTPEVAPCDAQIETQNEQQSKDSKEYCAFNRTVTQIGAFQTVFPEANWYKIEYRNANWHYITGEIFKNGKLYATAVGVPGVYSKHPPKWIEGFNLFLPIDQKHNGYWISLKDPNGKRILRY